jgi:hypothetical protein
MSQIPGQPPPRPDRRPSRAEVNAQPKAGRVAAWAQDRAGKQQMALATLRDLYISEKDAELLVSGPYNAAGDIVAADLAVAEKAFPGSNPPNLKAFVKCAHNKLAKELGVPLLIDDATLAGTYADPPKTREEPPHASEVNNYKG